MGIPHRLWWGVMRRRELLLAGLGAWAIEPVSHAVAQCGAEPDLLHRVVPSEQLDHLSLWEERSAQWRKCRPDDLPTAGPPILAIHVWADWCAACKEEFPLLRDLEARLLTTLARKMRFVYVAEIPNSPAMEQFQNANRQRLPKGPFYQDTAEIFARWLRPLLPGGRLTLPITLVVDDRRIIRHAILGSLRNRTRELARAVESLSELQTRK